MSVEDVEAFLKSEAAFWPGWENRLARQLADTMRENARMHAFITSLAEGHVSIGRGRVMAREFLASNKHSDKEGA